MCVGNLFFVELLVGVERFVFVVKGEVSMIVDLFFDIVILMVIFVLNFIK